MIRLTRNRSVNYGITFLIIGLSFFGLSIGNATAQHAPTGKFVEAVVQVVFADEQDSDHISLDRLNQASQEIHAFFDGLSYTNLDFEIRLTRVHLPKTRAEYIAQSKPWTYEATNAALVNDPGFFNDAKGLATLILNTYDGIDDTWWTLSAWPGIQQKIAHSTITEWPSPTYPPGPSLVPWGGWAHEFGHQLEIYGTPNLEVSGTWLGHPSGYNSGYDLMDSCYPCHQSGFGLLGTPLVTDSRTVFPGWLEESHVATVPKPLSGSSGQTFVLPPLSQNIANPVVQVVKIPVDNKRYYLAQARKRINNDALQAANPLGIFTEGVQIQFVDEDAEFPVKVCVPNPNPGCWSDDGTNQWPYQLWAAGNTFLDQVQKIKVVVVGAVTGGFQINVMRDVPPNHPDLFVTPWLTPPSNSYESVDIWVDSSCNGYEADGAALKYGRRADGTVIGNGDDPCISHENRVYATIHNIGDADAPATTATFDVSSPLGVGVTGSWTTLGSVSVPAIAKGKSADVYIAWKPSPSLTPQQIQEKHFQFHSCVRVTIASTSGELVTPNNSAQENIDVFEAVAQSAQAGESGNYKMPPMSDFFELTNSFVTTSVYLARVDKDRLRASFVSLKPNVNEATWTAYADNLEANLTDLHRRVQTGGYRALPSRRKQTRGAEGLEDKIVRTAVAAILGGIPSHSKQRFVLNTIAHLPAGWTYVVNHGRDTVDLDFGETRKIPVEINPADSPVGQIFNLEVGAFTQLTLQNPKSKHLSWYRAGGVTLSAHTVLPSQISVSGSRIVRGLGGASPSTLFRAEGVLKPPVPGAIITIDFYGRRNRLASYTTQVKMDGRFAKTVRLPFPPTGVRAIWQGDMTHASAIASAAIPSQ